MSSQRLKVGEKTTVDETDTRTPASDPEGGAGSNLDFALPKWIHREFRKLFDSGKFSTWETLADGYRYVFIEGLRHVLPQEVKPGFYRQLRLVQTILDDAAAETWSVRYLNQLDQRVQELRQKGDHQRIAEMLERHVHTLQQTTGELKDIARASDLAAELHRKYRVYLEQPEKKLKVVSPFVLNNDEEGE